VKKYLFLDIESTGLHEQDDFVHGIAVMREEDKSEYLPMWDLPQWFIDELKDPSVIKVIHSGKRFDLIFLQRAGLEIRGPIHDNLHIYHAINEHQSLGLKDLTTKYRGSEHLKSKRRLDKACHKAGVKNVAGLCKMDLKDPEHELLPIIAKYAVEDVENTFWLYFHGRELLQKKANSIKSVFGSTGRNPMNFLASQVFPLDSVLLDIDKRGVKADMGLLEKIRKEKADEYENIKQQMYTMCKRYVDEWEEKAYQTVVAGRKTERGKKAVKRQHKGSSYSTLWNWNSDKDIAEMLSPHTPAKLQSVTEKTGKPSLDKNAVVKILKNMDPNNKVHKFLTLYQEFKKVGKIATTYTGNAKKGIFAKIREGRLWTKYYQTTKTWRLGSSGPNLQNLPRKSVVHRFFIPDTPEHYFWVADYSQLELMCAAHFSQDEKMLEIYRDGGDIHRHTASLLFDVAPEEITDEQRQVGKTCNFLLIYKGNWQKLRYTIKSDAGLEFSEDECRYFVQRFFEEYSGLAAHLQKLETSARRLGYVYVPETGVVRSEPDIFIGDKLNWNNKTFGGSPEEVARCRKMVIDDAFKKGQKVNPTEEDIFWQAYRFYKSALNKLINFPCQHLGMYITGKALLAMHKKGYKVVNCVHDDIKIQLHKDNLNEAEILKDIMENSYSLNGVKLVADWDFRFSFHKKDTIDLDKAAKDVV